MNRSILLAHRLRFSAHALHPTPPQNAKIMRGFEQKLFLVNSMTESANNKP